MSNRTLEEAFKIDNLVDWLEKRNPTEHYQYRDGSCCLLAKYFTETLGKETRAGISTITIEGEGTRNLPFKFDWIAVGGRHWDAWTMGAALRRARQVQDQWVAEPASW